MYIYISIEVPRSSYFPQFPRFAPLRPSVAAACLSEQRKSAAATTAAVGRRGRSGTSLGEIP